MKKILKAAGAVLLSIIILLYCAFLFVLPKMFDLSEYKEQLLKIVKENSGLELDYENARLHTSPLLRLGVKADNITVKLPDNSVLFSADSIKTAVSLPHLLFLTLNIADAEIENPFINAEIMPSNEDYKIVKLIEDVMNEKKEASFGQKTIMEENTGFDFNSLKIVIPHLKLNNYKVLVKDLSSGHYLDLHGENFTFGWFNGEKISAKTNAELFSDENKNIQLNLDVLTFLPEAAPKLDSEDDPAEKIDFEFVNPVAVYQKYDLKASADAKIRVRRSKQSGISSFGYVNISDLTMKIADAAIPAGSFKVKAFGTALDTDINLYTHEKENLRISGKLNYGIHPNADMKIKTETIKLENLLSLAQAFMKSLNLPDELGRFTAKGTAEADCSIKTNFKKLFSTGFVKISDGGLSEKKLGSIISNMNINLVFDNNMLDIKNSVFYAGSAPVKIEGSIDKKSNVNISASAENIPLPLFFDAFAPKNIKKAYSFKSGSLSLYSKAAGRMKEAVYSADIKLSGFDFTDKKNGINVKNSLALSNSEYNSKNKQLSAELHNNDLKFLFPKTNSSIRLPLISASIQDNNILLDKSAAVFNDKSILSYSGSIENYPQPRSIDFLLEGALNTDDIIKFLGKEMKPFFNAKGAVPLKAEFSGDAARQLLFIKASADPENYITPVDFKMLQNLKTSLQAKAVFKPGRIKIKDTGLYTAASVIDENGLEQLFLNKIAGIEGTIEGNTINLIKIDIPKSLEGKISLFPNSKFTLDKENVYLYGKLDNPLIRGKVSISDIQMPEIFTAVKNSAFNFTGSEMYFNIDKLIAASSDMDIKGRIKPVLSPKINIYDLILNSNSLNADEAAVISEKAAAYMPKSAAAPAAPADIPVSVKNGRIDIKKIISGRIELFNTAADLALLNNILSLRRLSADIFGGKTKGNIFVNLKKMRVKTDLEGSGINTAKALLDASGMKDALSGALNYKAALLIDAGAQNFEAQIKGIKGEIDFSIKDGQFGPFGRIENLLLAENIRESKFFQTALGGIINSLATIDTTHFSELKGHVSLKDGICALDPVTSEGSAMNLHILGNFDIIKNYADMKVRVKLTSLISNLLGPISAVNPVNLINSAASLNVVTAKAFSLFCETVSEDEMDIMPKFKNAYVDSSASKIQLGVRGDAAKPLTLIKSFKWLVTQIEFNKAQEFVNSLPEASEENKNMSIEQAEAEEKAKAAALEAEKKTLIYKLKHLFKRGKRADK